METANKTSITVENVVKAPVEKVWNYYTSPEHVTKWNHASDDWHSPSATNDLRPGGQFLYRMEAKDGSFGFDFGGTYDQVKTHELISYTLGDGRQVENRFIANGQETRVMVTFEAEGSNPVEMQRGGWQAILDNFSAYTEAH